jgi:hypothetical protein
VQPQPVLLASRGESAQFLDGVDAASFGGLTDSDGARLGEVNVLPLGCDLLNGCRREFSINALGYEEFLTIGKELRGAAFIGLHVGGFTADDRVIGLTERGEY